MNQILKLVFILFVCENLLFATTRGHNGDEYFGDVSNNNYASFVYPEYKMALNGDAKVRKIFQVSSGVLKAPLTNPATYTSIGLNGSYKFADNLDENVSCAIAIPFELDTSSAPCLRVGFGCSATSGNVIFKIKYLYVGSNESINNTTPDETLYSTTTVSGVSYGYTYAEFCLSQISENDKFVEIVVERLGSQDTCNDDVYVIGLSLIYLSNKLGN